MFSASLVTGAAFAADISGDWKIEANLGETPITVNCTLIQTDDELTGSCVPVMDNPEPAELAGTVEGSRAHWDYDVVFNGNPGHVAYDAEIESDTEMSGTLTLSGTPLEFTARKQMDEDPPR
jgi:hypothetical protein